MSGRVQRDFNRARDFFKFFRGMEKRLGSYEYYDDIEDVCIWLIVVMEYFIKVA